MARHYDWSAPAKLYFWPAQDGADEEALYSSLTDALRAAGEGDSACAWIITQDGDILNPRMIELLREDLAPRARRPARTGLFAWARAA